MAHGAALLQAPRPQRHSINRPVPMPEKCLLHFQGTNIVDMLKGSEKHWGTTARQWAFASRAERPDHTQWTSSYTAGGSGLDDANGDRQQ